MLRLERISKIFPTGEVLKDVSWEIKNGDRIAQIVIAKHERSNWNLVEELEESKRGAGGFGSTGKQ